MTFAEFTEKVHILQDEIVGSWIFLGNTFGICIYFRGLKYLMSSRLHSSPRGNTSCNRDPFSCTASVPSRDNCLKLLQFFSELVNLVLTFSTTGLVGYSDTAYSDSWLE